MLHALLDESIVNSDDLAPLRNDIMRGEKAAATLAIARQRSIAEAEARIERCHVEGLGRLRMRVDAGVYFRMIAIHGAGCWDDESFLHSFEQKNAGAAIRSQSRKMKIQVNGLRA